MVGVVATVGLFGMGSCRRRHPRQRQGCSRGGVWVSTGTPPVEVTATHYAVSCLPLDHMQRALFTLTVEYRGEGTWTVLHRGFCIGRRGQRCYEPIPSMRTERFKRAYRFDLGTALALARREAPKLTGYGRSVADVLADSGAAS